MIYNKKLQSIESANYYGELEWKQKRRNVYRDAVKAVVDTCATTVVLCIGQVHNSCSCTFRRGCESTLLHCLVFKAAFPLCYLSGLCRALFVGMGTSRFHAGVNN